MEMSLLPVFKAWEPWCYLTRQLHLGLDGFQSHCSTDTPRSRSEAGACETAPRMTRSPREKEGRILENPNINIVKRK